MLIEEIQNLENLPGALRDVDLSSTGNWIGVTEFGSEQVLIFGGATVPLPERVWYPQVAAIDDSTALVVDSRTKQKNNAWVITSEGKVLADFFVGDAVEDVLASETTLVVTYFDEAYGSTGVEGNGVSVFRPTGEYRFGYNEFFTADAVHLVDCYCVCWAGRDQIYFLSYTDFPLVLLNVSTQTQQKWATPQALHGSHAITTVGPTVYFHGPYEDKPGVYKWRPGSQQVHRIGEIVGNVRGVSRGRFLQIRDNAFSILVCPE